MTQHTTIVSALRGPVKLHEWTLNAEVKAKFGTRCKQKSARPAMPLRRLSRGSYHANSMWGVKEQAEEAGTLNSSPHRPRLALDSGLQTFFYKKISSWRSVLQIVMLSSSTLTLGGLATGLFSLNQETV